MNGKPTCPARIFEADDFRIVAEEAPDGLRLAIHHGATGLRVRLSAEQARLLAKLIGDNIGDAATGP